MNTKTDLRPIIELNIAVLFISTSGFLGRYIDLPVPVVTGLRAAIAVGCILCFTLWQKANLNLQKKDRFTVLFSGVLMAGHWITYFYALKLSNVAIGMLSLFTFPVITVFLEPILLKTPFDKTNLFLGVLVLIGIYFLVPDFNIESTYLQAIALGILSAFCYALRNIIMKANVGRYQGAVLMVYQLLVIAVAMVPFYFLMDTSNVLATLPATLTLGILTTAIGHTFFLYTLKNFSTATASIMGSIQPIYGILLGILFLGEYPHWTTLIGGSFILASVGIASLKTFRTKPLQN